MNKDPFKEYIRETEPSKKEKAYVWGTAIGLQAVDGLKPSEHSWYFRNALVRANYNDLKQNIHETTEFLELFLRNLLLDEKNPISNRSLHISEKGE